MEKAYHVEYMCKSGKTTNLIVEQGLTADAVATLFASPDILILTVRLMF
jgi:hypothetical protein